MALLSNRDGGYGKTGAEIPRRLEKSGDWEEVHRVIPSELIWINRLSPVTTRMGMPGKAWRREEMKRLAPPPGAAPTTILTIG